MTRDHLERLVWRCLHRDYKSKLGGVRFVLSLDEKTGGSCLLALSSLSDETLIARLPASERAQCKETFREYLEGRRHASTT